MKTPRLSEGDTEDYVIKGGALLVGWTKWTPTLLERYLVAVHQVVHEITSSGKQFKVSEGKRNEGVSGVSESGVSDPPRNAVFIGEFGPYHALLRGKRQPGVSDEKNGVAER